MHLLATLSHFLLLDNLWRNALLELADVRTKELVRGRARRRERLL